MSSAVLLQQGPDPLLVQLRPGLRVGRWVCAQGGFGQPPNDPNARQWTALCRQLAAAAEPQRVDGQLTAFAARLIDRMGVEQHLHFVLQAAQQARLGTGWQPCVDIARDHPVE